MILDQEKIGRIKNSLKFKQRGMSISEIATQLQMNRNSVAKYLEILLMNGEVESRKLGTSKVYTVSQRVPLSGWISFSSDMIMIINPAGQVLQANDPFLKFCNMTREEIIGHDINDLTHSLLDKVPLDNFLKESHEKKTEYFEISLNSNGIRKFFRGKLVPIIFEDSDEGILLIFEDISDRKRTEMALAEREQQYRAVIENIQDVFYRSDIEGNLIMASPSWASMLGYDSLEECIGKNIAEIFYWEPEKRKPFLDAVYSKRKVDDYEVVLKTKEGRPFYVSTNSHLYFDTSGKILGVEGIFRDINERHSSAEKIQDYVSKMEFLTRKAQEFVELSPEADIFKMIGQGLSELLPTAVINVNSYDPLSETLTVRAVFSEKDSQILSDCIGQEYLGFQYTLRSVPLPLKTNALSDLIKGTLFHSDETLYDFLFQQFPKDICDRIKEILNLGDRYYGIGLVRHGILFGVAAFSLRKSEKINNSSLIETFARQASIVLHRRITEDSLMKSESRYRGIVEDQTEFVTRFLPDGTITYVNDSMCRYFLKNRAELHGRSIYSISGIPKDDHYKLILGLHSLNALNPVQSIEYRVHDSTDCIRWTQWTHRAFFDNNGNIFEYQGVGRDITEQKEAETKVRQYIADIEFLSRKSTEFLELSPDADIYGTICRGVKEILPKAIVLVNSFDLKNDATTRSMLGDAERTIFSELMEEDIIGKIVKLPKTTDGDNAIRVNMTGKIIPVPGNLFIATQKQVPEAVCKKIEETLNIGDIYLIGLVSHGIIVADVVIMLQKGDKLGHIDLIETYIRQAANALLRYKTAESLRESEKLYQSVIENIQDVFYRSDTKGNLIMALPRGARLLGYDSLDDCIGYNIADKFYFEPQRRKEFLAAVYRNGSVRDYEVVLKHRDGRPIHVSCNGHLYYDDAGLLLGIEGILHNINERNIANDMMIEKSPNPDVDKKIDGTSVTKTSGMQGQLYLSNALKMAQDSISILDLSGRCIWINDAFITIISPRKNEMLIGKSFARFIAPEDRKNALDCMKDVRKSGNKRITLSLLTPCGRIPADASLSSIHDNEDGIIGYMTIIRQVEKDHGKLYSEKNLQKKRGPKL